MMPLYLLAAFGKNEKANISAEKRNTLSEEHKRSHGISYDVA